MTQLQSQTPSASGSSFYTAMRILPRQQREAMFAIYRFCREVDDIADGDGARAQRLAALDRWRQEIAAFYCGDASNIPNGLSRAIDLFHLAEDDFFAVIAGMEMDVVEDIRAPDLATLDLYCDRVACAVGRLSTPVFGLKRELGRQLAEKLGRALQLTNILRDLDEDAEIGRLYLPREFLREAGIDADDPASVLLHPNIAAPCRQVALLAYAYFASADAVMNAVERRTVRAPRIMANVYRSVLHGLEQRGWAAPRPPVGVGRGRIAWILLRAALS